MIHERQKRLVERLLERSQLGELNWQESFDPDHFQVSFPNSSVMIAQVRRSSSPSYIISIIDSNGRVTDAFTDTQLDEDKDSSFNFWNARMRDLFYAVRRKALKADEILDKLLAEIG